MFSSLSVLQRAAAALLQEQHPQSQNEDSEDEHPHRALLHRLLDALLPAGSVVLVLPRRPGGEGVPLSHPHPLHLRALQRLLGPRHLRPLHHTLPQGSEELLPPGHRAVRAGLTH